MARIVRVVAPGLPHHITQRGNRRQETFFSDEEYQAYRDLMAEWCSRFTVAVWAYCLMPNHGHVMAVREVEVVQMEKHERTGRPLGAAHFVQGLEKVLGRTLMPNKAGRKPKRK